MYGRSMKLAGYAVITLEQPRLFAKKLTALIIGTAILMPLVYFKLYVPAQIYVGILLVLHIYFFYVYLTRVDWRRLWFSRSGFIIRVTGIVFFSYLLTVLQFDGPVTFVLMNIVAATIIHALILLLLMCHFSRN